MTYTARYLGFDVSTSAVTVLVTDAQGNFATASVPMYGACRLYGQPAHDVTFIPLMLAYCLQQLQLDGWVFTESGTVGFSFRQHDLLILGEGGFRPLLPALSWQFDPSITGYAAALNTLPHVTNDVGRLEPRFALAKLDWLIDQHPGLRNHLNRQGDPSVMLTGDWVVGCLADCWGISTSDGRCNGLIAHSDGELAVNAFHSARFAEDWFPAAIPGGNESCPIEADNVPDGWQTVASILDGWTVVASLGDNHAGAIGSGLGETDADESLVVASFGTSGTAVRQVKGQTPLQHDRASVFDFFGRDLLLSMLHSCGGAFDRVRQPSGIPASRLDQLAWEAVLGNPVSEIPRVVLSESAEGPDGYPPEWGGLEAGKQAAGVLLAIAAGMAQQVDTVVSAHDGEIDTVSMTGGLSAAPILRQAFRVALAELGHTPQLRVSQREVARDQAAAWGAMLTAWRNDADLASVISACCPNEACLVDSALDSRLGEYMAEVLG